MGKLRMKETSKERAERELKERLKPRPSSSSSTHSHSHKKKRRRRHRSSYDDSSSSSSSSERAERGERAGRPSKYYRSQSEGDDGPSDGREGTTRGKRREREKGKGKGKEKEKTNAIDEEEEDADDSDAYVPPRPSASRPYVPYSYTDSDPESRLHPPPGASFSSHRARKPDAETARARAEQEELDFNQRLFDAMKDDEGFDPYSASGRSAGLSFDYREPPDVAMRGYSYGLNGVYQDRYEDPQSGFILNRVIFKDAMNEDEYANHIRSGMYRRTKRGEIEAMEAREAERKLREKREAENILRTKALEAERMRKLEERARRKEQERVSQSTVKTREAYQAAWARLVDPKRQEEELRMEDFPWPVRSMEHGGGGGGGAVDREAVREFLTAHLQSAEGNEDGESGELLKRRKQAIRTAVLAYHPDRFERYVLRVREKGGQRDSVRQMGLRISQVLNELLQTM